MLFKVKEARPGERGNKLSLGRAETTSPTSSAGSLWLRIQTIGTVNFVEITGLPSPAERRSIV